MMSRDQALPFVTALAAVVMGATASVAVAQQPAPHPLPPARAPAPSVQQSAAPATTLPNGATAINETYGDWTVDCRLVEGRKHCLLVQAQRNTQTGQRIYAIELSPPAGGKTEGTILMPFGLNLDAGAVLKLDDKDLGKGLRFSTCIPQGCLLPVSFPTVATDAMRKGTKLTVASLNLSSADAITFNVSLSEFGTALDRLAHLAR